MIVCAVHAGSYTLEHFWSETCKDGDQFDMEPTKKVLFSELWERGTDDDVGLVHDAIPHVNLELWDLAKYDMREIQHH